MSWRSFLVLAVLLPMGALGACSDPPEKPPAGEGSTIPVGGGGRVEGGTTEGGSEGGLDAGDGGVCNDLTNAGQTIDRVGIVGEPPAARGGVIADGTYNLTEYALYVGAGGLGGPTGITAKATLRIIDGVRVDERYEFGGSGNPSVRSTSGTFSATASTFASTELCPSSAGGKQRQFTSNDPVLLLIDPVTKEAFTFTKR